MHPGLVRGVNAAAFVSLSTLVSVSTGTRLPAQAGPAHLPAQLALVANAGQWPDAVRHGALRGPHRAWFLADGWMLDLSELLPPGRVPEPGGSGSRIALRAGAEPARSARLRFRLPQPVPVEPAQPQPGRHHFFLGAEPAQWRRDVPAYGRLCYREIAPGTDLVVREGSGLFAYDLHLQRASALEEVAFAIEGHAAMRVAADGALLIDTELGTLRQSPPVAWQTTPAGARLPVAASFVLLGADHFGFTAAGLDPDLPLVVDPGLEWSSFFGGSGADWIEGLALTGDGSPLLCGSTSSFNLPTTATAYQKAIRVPQDAFVARLSADGSALVWCTYYGGSGIDIPLDMLLTSTGALVGGMTTSTDLPVAGVAPGGAMDGFVFRLAMDGGMVAFTHYFGGSGGDWIARLAPATTDAGFFVAGFTDSTNLPSTPGCYQAARRGGRDLFVCRLAPSLATTYCTYLGGSADEGLWTASWPNNPIDMRILGLAADAQDRAVVASTTFSTDFPTTAGVVAPTWRGGSTDALVAMLEPDGKGLTFATFLGGNGYDACACTAIEASGTIAVAGYTYSSDFPTTSGAFDRTFGGGAGMNDAFVVRLTSRGTSLAYATFLGGTDYDSATSLLADRHGLLTIGGFGGAAFPTSQGSLQPFSFGGQSGFVTRLDPAGRGGSDLIYSTLFGGMPGCFVNVMALTDAGLGAIAIAGPSSDPSLPTTTGGYATTFAGGASDGFATRLDLLPHGVTRLGTPTPACLGPVFGLVRGQPRPGNSTFAVYCQAAPPGARGAVILGAPFASGSPILNVAMFVDLQRPWLAFPVLADPSGAAILDLPLPWTRPPTGRVAVQFGWENTAACGNGSWLSAAAALRF